MPSSKSIAHRVIIAAALSGGGETRIRGVSKDIEVTREFLSAMMTCELGWHCGECCFTLRFLTLIAVVMVWKGMFVCE